MDRIEDESAREPYEAPIVEDIPLHSDEQILAGCKTPPHPGPGVFICGTGSAPCKKQGPS